MQKVRYKPRRFNESVVRSAADLFSAGKSADAVARDFFLRFGSAWGVHSVALMHEYLFTPRPGYRPNFLRMFGGKTPAQIEAAYEVWLQKWLARRKGAAARLKDMRKDPGFAHKANRNLLVAKSKDDFETRRKAGVRRFYSSPENAKLHAANVGRAKQAYWNRIRAELSAALESRGLVIEPGVKDKSLTTRRMPRSQRDISHPVRMVIRKGSSPQQRALLMQERNERVARVISELPTMERHAIDAIYFEGMSLEDAAKRLGINAITLQRKLTIAYRFLAPKLRGHI